jgi:hypothetical protein
MLVWCKLSLACVLLVLASLHHSPPMVGSQTLAQEERFEACCEKSKIPLTSKCSYRMLLWMFNYGPEVDTNPPPNLKDDLTGDMLFFGCDHWDYACANKLWPSYIECLNNGMDNRECCFATTNFKGQQFPYVGCVIVVHY